jgi:hypothetical protein
MIRKLVAAAVLAMILAPLASLHLLCAADTGASISVLGEDGVLVLELELRGLARIEPLLAAAIL